MIVRELIAALGTLDPDAIVVMHGYENDGVEFRLVRSVQNILVQEPNDWNEAWYNEGEYSYHSYIGHPTKRAVLIDYRWDDNYDGEVV